VFEQIGSEIFLFCLTPVHILDNGHGLHKKILTTRVGEKLVGG
jgi:hypothetical protein